MTVVGVMPASFDNVASPGRADLARARLRESAVGVPHLSSSANARAHSSRREHGRRARRSSTRSTSAWRKRIPTSTRRSARMIVRDAGRSDARVPPGAARAAAPPCCSCCSSRSRTSSTCNSRAPFAARRSSRSAPRSARAGRGSSDSCWPKDCCSHCSAARRDSWSRGRRCRFWSARLPMAMPRSDRHSPRSGRARRRRPRSCSLLTLVMGLAPARGPVRRPRDQSAVRAAAVGREPRHARRARRRRSRAGGHAARQRRACCEKSHPTSLGRRRLRSDAPAHARR